METLPKGVRGDSSEEYRLECEARWIIANKPGPLREGWLDRLTRKRYGGDRQKIVPLISKIVELEVKAKRARALDSSSAPVAAAKDGLLFQDSLF
jgi:hypothetical protein